MGMWTLLFEGLIVIFLIYMIIGLILQRDYRTISELVAGIIFGFILEFTNVFFTKSYTYNPQFILQLGQVPNNIPLSIVCAWGIIMISTHRIIKRYNLSAPAEICAEALLGLTLDIGMDIIAIRLDGGFWNWLTVPFISSVSWLCVGGVPWGNYYGWFCVILIAGTLFHIERKRISSERKGLLLILILVNPIISAICLIGLLSIYVFFILSGIFTKFPPILVLFFGMVIGVAFIIVIINRIRTKSTITYSQSIQPILFFVSFHLFFIIAAIVEGIFMEMWGLIIVEGILLTIAMIVDIKSLKGPKFTFL